jgi:hypothetical protein
MPTITIKAPVGGISKQLAFQDQPPFSSYSSVNYWPVDVRTGRATSAVRPPIVPFGTQTGLVTALNRVSGIAPGKPNQSFAAAFDGQLFWWNGSVMESATGSEFDQVDTDRYVSSTPIVNQLVLASSDGAPLVFDYPAGTLERITASEGVVPEDVSIVAQWQGALWVVNETVISASRVGDITDWDFSAVVDDLFGAFFTDLEYEGMLAGPITALIPFTTDVMLVSTTAGTVAFRGHPRQGGIVDRVSGAYVLGQGAWTTTPTGEIFALTQHGLMAVQSPQNPVFTPISKERIPDELLSLLFAVQDPLVNLIYDSRWNGIHIFVRGLQEQYWWFNLSNPGFHQGFLPSFPHVVTEFPDFITESTSGVLVGGFGGLRIFDRFGTESINSSLLIGPVKISESPSTVSKVMQARVTFARDTPNQSGIMRMAAGGGRPRCGQ